jgi:hypothetical protein
MNSKNKLIVIEILFCVWSQCGEVLDLPDKTEQRPDMPVDEVCLFDLSPALGISGGIQRFPDEAGVFSAARGGICVYWLIENVDAIAIVIEHADGRILSGRQKEADQGGSRFFEDTY